MVTTPPPRDCTSSIARWIACVLSWPGAETAPNSRTETTSPGDAAARGPQAAQVAATPACRISRRLIRNGALDMCSNPYRLRLEALVTQSNV